LFIKPRSLAKQNGTEEVKERIINKRGLNEERSAEEQIIKSRKNGTSFVP